MEKGEVELYILRVHGDGFTIDFDENTEIDAEVHAYELMGRGVRSGNKIYPARNIVYYEILKNNEQ